MSIYVYKSSSHNEHARIASPCEYDHIHEYERMHALTCMQTGMHACMCMHVCMNACMDVHLWTFRKVNRLSSIGHVDRQ